MSIPELSFCFLIGLGIAYWVRLGTTDLSLLRKKITCATPPRPKIKRKGIAKKGASTLMQRYISLSKPERDEQTEETNIVIL